LAPPELEVDLLRDEHLTLLDDHLLPLFNIGTLSEHEVYEAAMRQPKLAGALDRETTKRWVQSAIRRELLRGVGEGRYGLTKSGASRAQSLPRRLTQAKVSIPGGGAVAAALKAVSAATLAKGAAGASLIGGPGVAAALHGRLYRHSRKVVELVAAHDQALRAMPEEMRNSLKDLPSDSK
jgi:hypothetical protein